MRTTGAFKDTAKSLQWAKSNSAGSKKLPAQRSRNAQVELVAIAQNATCTGSVTCACGGNRLDYFNFQRPDSRPDSCVIAAMSDRIWCLDLVREASRWPADRDGPPR